MRTKNKDNITLEEFKKEFEKAGKGNCFSEEGFKALYNALTWLESDMGEPLMLDIPWICSSFKEYPNYGAYLNDNGDPKETVWVIWVNWYRLLEPNFNGRVIIGNI